MTAVSHAQLHESYRESLSDQDRQAVLSNYELLQSRIAQHEAQLAVVLRCASNV